MDSQIFGDFTDRPVRAEKLRLDHVMAARPDLHPVTVRFDDSSEGRGEIHVV